ncbi:hypothetical protein BDB00DRAFT_853837 [Zychaea mexicana]|uniref:uncharacterized protein n=1 Tax=Zychaea mexicana TaxID=64656 RepID=UPI0022FE5A3F|nr:uncharacterized protein BDB00DRAFT_853837 [Zychaea mexicana]KAI9484736.1 hypothetical protein BDB00DRAFT_853837 [Zychaea mexicana]
MDIHSSFDEFLDLRDQHEEGGLLQQQGESIKSQSGQHPNSTATLMTNGENAITIAATAATEDNNSTLSAQENGAVATVSTWNMTGSDGSLAPEHAPITHNTNNNDNGVVNAATGATTSAAAAAATMGDPNQPFYFPLDSASWASVFAASDMNTAALTAFMNENQQEAAAAAAAAGAVVPLANTDASSAPANVSQQQHYIPPQQMLLQQPPLLLASSTASPVPTITAAATTTTTTTTIATDNDTMKNNNNEDNSDKSATNVELPEAKEQEEVDTGRMKTRSSLRLRTTVSNKPANEEPSSNPTTTTTTTTETPKKKTKGKRLYCICQQPYTGFTVLAWTSILMRQRISKHGFVRIVKINRTSQLQKTRPTRSNRRSRINSRLRPQPQPQEGHMLHDKYEQKSVYYQHAKTEHEPIHIAAMFVPHKIL